MIEDQYTDRTLVDLWEVWNPPDERDDLTFYLGLVMAARSVLDVGAGTGSLLRLARQAGHTGRLTGLDPSPSMLEQARTRPDVEWVLGDLSTVRWDREFDLVVMMGHTFHQFIEDEEIRSTLAAIHAALVDGGRFAFEVHNPLIRPWETWATDYQRQENDAHGAVVNVESTAEPSDREDVFVFTWTFSSPAWDEPKVSRGPMRFLGAEALSSFLSEAGFVTEEHYGSWDRHPLTATSEEIITVARKR